MPGKDFKFFESEKGLFIKAGLPFEIEIKEDKEKNKERGKE